MNLKIITIVLITTTFVLWAVWDIVLVVYKDNTISQHLQRFSKANTWFSYFMGFLSGHWFLSTKKTLKYGWIIAISFMALLGVWDLAHYLKDWTYDWYRHAIIWFPIGLLAGCFLWGQGDSESPI